MSKAPTWVRVFPKDSLDFALVRENCMKILLAMNRDASFWTLPRLF